MNGIIIVDKPKDWTSQDVATKIKRTLKVDKVGHAGTLDPLATGVLVILVNGATKLSDYLLNEDKVYECEIVIGKATDTEDVMGTVTESKEVTNALDVDSVLEGLIGPLEQMPPMYSSIHHNGKKLYELARKGIVVERVSRTIEVFDIKRTSEIVYENNEARFSFMAKVSKGTYIRTLCVEIGNRLNFPAYMNELRRLRSGNFDLASSVTIEDIINGNYELIPMIESLKSKRVIEVNEEEYRKIENGMKINLDETALEVVLTKGGELIAIYEKDNNMYKAKRIWK